jgi:CobQ-like glutamine amidotransferase family enzyme
LEFFVELKKKVKRGKIELAIQLTCDKLGHKLGDAEYEILEGYGLIGVRSHNCRKSTHT